MNDLRGIHLSFIYPTHKELCEALSYNSLLCRSKLEIVEMSKLGGGVVETAISAIAEDVTNEKSRLAEIFKKVASHPIKMVAAFFTAPIMMVRVALKVDNPIRRIIAISGLIIAILLAYLAGTFLGTLAGAALIASQVGILVATGFLIGSALSVMLSVTFSILVFNFVSLIFLKMSTQEVVDYLHELSQ